MEAFRAPEKAALRHAGYAGSCVCAVVNALAGGGSPPGLGIGGPANATKCNNHEGREHAVVAVVSGCCGHGGVVALSLSGAAARAVRAAHLPAYLILLVRRQRVKVRGQVRRGQPYPRPLLLGRLLLLPSQLHSLLFQCCMNTAVELC